MLNGAGPVSIFFQTPSYREGAIPKEVLVIRGGYKKELFWLLFVLTPLLYFFCFFIFDPPFIFF